jgi:2-amino-4-hydroxy-6-hydroxymethyldihydropteridine diphosphokinase
MPRGASTVAYVAVGSNLGDREAHLALARQAIAELPGCCLLRASRVEETEPLGGMRQPPYLNQMLEVETSLEPEQLLAALQRIEAAAGRTRTERWAPRTLDLDIVLYDELVTDSPSLTLPHPGLADRDFWQRELAELREGR